MTSDNDKLRFGSWCTETNGLPYFHFTAQDDKAPEAPFRHLITTGHVSAMADRWGNVNLFTTEGGFVWLNSPESGRARGSIYLMAEVEGELLSLIYSELTSGEGIRIGTGFVEYTGVVKTDQVHLRVTQQVYAAPNRQRHMSVSFTLQNLGKTAFRGRVEIRGDVAPTRKNPPGHDKAPPTEIHMDRPGWAIAPDALEEHGDIFLSSDSRWRGLATRQSLRLLHDAQIEPGGTQFFQAAVGYGSHVNTHFDVPSLEEVQAQWAEKLAAYRVPAAEPWMARECLWNSGQLLSFTAYDSAVDEYYISLGGYGWAGFSVREVSQTSMVLAPCDWELTAASLRFVAKTQLASGDVPKIHTMRHDRVSEDFDSDNELWFLLGCCECILTSNRIDFLDEVCRFWDEDEGTIWEHMKRAFYWIRDQIGTGKRGLILIREGDWNDYLSLMGARGQGESVMNSGVACRVLPMLARFARQRREESFAAEVENFYATQSQAVEAMFDQSWFRYGYTDAGKAVGSHAENRVYLNAQSWPVLGKCGTAEQRRSALLSAIKHCHTDIGLMLMSRPYSSPAPDDISWCGIPAGDGENSGIWPQAAHWFVWALIEEGMLEEALSEWKCATLHSHAHHFPEIPYGIFNGPDCFSSKWAGKREGGTQVQLLNRALSTPMNPMVAWQAFTLRKFNHAALAQR